MSASVALSHFCDDHGPTVLLVTTSTQHARTVTASPSCASCKSLEEDERRIISREEDSERSWASVKVPSASASQPADALLRRLALRALSFEGQEADRTMIFKVKSIGT